MENLNTYTYTYGIYDTEANTYRYFFSCNNDAQAKRQTVAYCVGSNDLFNEPLELHRISKIGTGYADVSSDFCLVCSYTDIKNVVLEHREKTNRITTK